MTKASIPRGIPRQIMFHSDAMITGPTKGHTINIRNKGPCQINEARLVLEEKTGHTYYRIVAVDYDGSHYVAELPSEVLQFTGWSWSDTSIPFEIEIHPVEHDSEEDMNREEEEEHDHGEGEAILIGFLEIMPKA